MLTVSENLQPTFRSNRLLEVHRTWRVASLATQTFLWWRKWHINGLCGLTWATTTSVDSWDSNQGSGAFYSSAGGAGWLRDNARGANSQLHTETRDNSCSMTISIWCKGINAKPLNMLIKLETSQTVKYISNRRSYFIDFIHRKSVPKWGADLKSCTLIKHRGPTLLPEEHTCSPIEEPVFTLLCVCRRVELTKESLRGPF